MTKCIIMFLAFLSSVALAADLTAPPGHPAWTVLGYIDENVTTNHASHAMNSIPFDTLFNLSDDGVSIVVNWTGDPADTPTQGELDAANTNTGRQVEILMDAIRNGTESMIPIRKNAASNIVALASAYGVTNQPVPWAAVALAMQAERADATASNDIMRLLTVVGDGTTMLSFKEFYTENGGDILDVRWP